MNRNNTFKWFLVVFILVWAVYSFYPPNDRNLIAEFEQVAEGKDAAFTSIVQRARELEKNSPQNYQNLLRAVGTNDITRYFPKIPTLPDTDRTRTILGRVQSMAAGKIKKGLDIQGGTSFLVGVDMSKLIGAGGSNETRTIDKAAVLEQAIEVLRKRVDKFGVAEPVIQPVGDNRILIQLPGLSEESIDEAIVTLQKAAYLEFRLVKEDSDELLSQGLSAPGYEKLILKSTRKGKETATPFLVEKKPAGGLTGKYVERAGVTRDMVSNRPEISLRFDKQGTEIFAQVTRDHVGRLLGIVLDGQLYSAPRINGSIPGGSASITGDFDLKEALELANVLENPLEAPVKIEDQRGVDPSLGRDSIESGIRAAVIGIVLVAGFMLVYYQLAGLVANVAMILNTVILLGVLAAVGTTLTIPGIAGIVLTVGMAVDANVLIYERIREELAAGKSMRGAIAAGYSKAFGTIFDSHLTTLIASIILIYKGTGPVKGFGVTLTIGVLLSLFTALIITRLIFDWMLAKDMLKKLTMLHLIKNHKIDFMKWAKPAFAVSWLLILIGLSYGAIRGKNALGVDFAGGDSLTLTFSQNFDTKEGGKIRQAADKMGIGEVSVQLQTGTIDGKKTVQIVTPFEKGSMVEKGLKTQFPDAQFARVRLDHVGPVVGGEILKSALVASLLAIFGILIYVAMRYEFSFAVGAVVAIFHDIFMTMGWFFLTGRQLSAPIVAAVLTIIGFSINDTVVIFDRIREDLKLGVKGSFRDIMNQALNQTLSRTIITSGTVFLATASLYLFGGGVINDFAFTFLVGILTGTYSSIYIASAIVLWWHRGERPKAAASQVVLQNTVDSVRA